MTDLLALNLQAVRQEHFAFVGGKAANLAKLIHLDVPTVNGFCITTRAYRRFVQESGMDNAIVKIMSGIDTNNLEQISISCDQIRDLFECTEVPQDIINAIHSEFVSLDNSPVAVRSSATAEDSPEASFAGQQESYLNVVGFEEVLKHTRYCWASLWTPRAVLYRARQGIGNHQVYMAVVVQKMIQAELSGVLFTKNPLNDLLSQMVINSSYGLGEAIVSGSVTPDTFILDKTSLRVVQTEVGKKETMVLADGKGGVQNQQVETTRQALPSLSSDQIKTLAGFGRQVEDYFGYPQDIEWAYANGEFYILQARPITTQKLPKKASMNRHNRLELFLLEFLQDYFPIAPYHFDRSVLLSLIDATVGLEKAFGLIPPDAKNIVSVEHDGSISLNPILPKWNWATPFGVLRGAIYSFRNLKTSPNVWLDNHWPDIEREVKAIHTVKMEALDDEKLFTLIKQCVAIRDEKIFLGRSEYFLGGFMATSILPLLIRWIVGKSDAGPLYFALMSGLDSPTAIMNRQFRKLARMALAESALKDALVKGVSENTWQEIERTQDGKNFLDGVSEFLNQFGVRTGMLIPYPSVPIWEENPTKVLSLIEIMLRSPEMLETAFEELQKRQSRDAELQIIRQARKFPLMLFRIDRTASFFIKYVQAMTIERDWIIFAYESVNRPMRKAMLELDRRLLERGITTEPNDIRFLSLDEVESAIVSASTNEFNVSLRLTIEKRKRGWAGTTANWNSAASAELNNTTSSIVLKGTPASPGISVGEARVVLSESEFTKLRPGEILVCRATNPSWTPLFLIASAVVTDTGGPLSHAAIVTREYGIPAVLGTKNATGVMKNGQSYIVDGSKGEVREN